MFKSSSSNLRGKVRNFSLPKYRPLVPLYEAIVNAINAIDERGNKHLQFNVYVCGINSETFTKKIMIYKPTYAYTKFFSKKDLGEMAINRLSDLVTNIKQDNAMKEVLGEWGLENISTTRIYIHYRDCLLGLLDNKVISDVFDYFKCDNLVFSFFIVGGASIHNETSYRFTVHPNEEIHRNTPHVHVSKDGVDIRYSLETLQPMDLLVYPHRRDNRRIIIPFLLKNQKRLLNYWKLYRDGYTSPSITQEGQQFYGES